MMVPAAIVDGIIADLAPHLEEGDTIIDGGNSYYVDDLRRSGELSGKGLHYLDVGVSGGVWGLHRGYCMMVGGDDEAVERLEPVLDDLAPGVEAAERTPGRAAISRSREGLAALRPERRRALREDGSQRDRVRAHGAYAEGQHAEARNVGNTRGETMPRPRRSQSRPLPIRPRPRRSRPRCGGGEASSGSWLLDLTAAALVDSPIWTASRAGSPTRARAAGRYTPRSTSPCRRRSCPPRCTSASTRAARPSSRTGSSPQCGTPSAATSRSRHDPRSREAGEPAPRRPRARADAESCAIVIFGASGNLTHKKLFPALYSLAFRHLLPRNFAVLGVARTENPPSRSSART